MIDLKSLYWFAGFYEGEGFSRFHGSIIIAINQVQRWPLDKVQQLFGGTIKLRKSYHHGWSDQWKWEACGPRATGILLSIYALLSPKRQEQIIKTMKQWREKQAGPGLKHKCKNGHAYLPNNLVVTSAFYKGRMKTWRRCKICNTQSKRKHFKNVVQKKYRTDPLYRERILENVRRSAKKRYWERKAEAML